MNDLLEQHEILVTYCACVAIASNIRPTREQLRLLLEYLRDKYAAPEYDRNPTATEIRRRIAGALVVVDTTAPQEMMRAIARMATSAAAANIPMF